jgi:hypothetical protein
MLGELAVQLLAAGEVPGYAPADILAAMTDGVTTALPYLGIGVAVGAPLFGIGWGINKAIKTTKKVGNAA